MAARFPGYVPAGVIPAALMPFNEDLSIDEKSLRAHIRDLASVRGISALCVNGVSQEIPGLTLDEQRRALDVMADEVGDQVPLMHGVYAHGPLDAARIARQAEADGASCLLVFPPAVFVRGAAMLPEMTLGHYKAIADATDLPLIVFQYETSTGMAHPLDTLVKLAEAVPSVMAIKDRSNNPIEHERNIRVLQSLARPVNVLTTHSAWLMPSLVLGCNGILSGSGSVHADLHVALWEAVQANDLAAARAINDQIYPMASCFYSAPTLDMHTRMKEALVMLGRLPSGRVRLPWVDLSDAERARVRAALVQAGRLPA
ncbi:dihydrodipicolinate synthase family protein [Bordetella pertussis]|uniref:dihydrodipicolinate synthase family protein n=1 Tax=Bordetella pertussis TaxID=520 RepID=UPI0005DA7B3E|nr:dihydrodipicolinate synthase family protein [Bordetella pertussis]ASX30888.1 dihydrodipicolinate synthase family protein [Bordetella pertussis]CFO96328.1 dihydrodipicolinate synthase [Bordetella pertussis]CFW34177.1 dihydrodipicolinate synthase [Bordetella pertussis]CPI09166.1 dihydrodipicolinate synthase [Bordetella pertussis]CPJ88918.1 dihydrodipicolinate synthase [Bordetella pertussis]